MMQWEEVKRGAKLGKGKLYGTERWIKKKAVWILVFLCWQ